MPITPVKPTRKEQQEQIKELLRAAPETSDRAIARSLNCSPTTVGTIRMEMIKRNQLGHLDTSNKVNLSNHPYLRENPEILINHLTNKRKVRALKREGVLDMMAARRYTSAVYAERQMRLEERAKLKSPLSGLTADDYRVFVADIHKGLSMVEDRTITHLVCDPPYKRELLLPLLDSLGKAAQRILTDDGIVLVMVGGSWLPDAMQTLGKHLRHWWQLAYITDRAAPHLQHRSVSTYVKWVLMYTRQGETFRGKLFSDLIKTPPDIGDKDAHEWGQSVDGFAELIQRFVLPQQEHLVYDPFCGSGATLRACARLGVRAMGSDVSEQCVKDTRRLLDAEFAAMAAAAGDTGEDGK